MLQIQDALVSLDLAERYFHCDLDKCLGECCIEGDAGAPITEDEYQKLKSLKDVVWDDLLPAAQERIREAGVGYIDEEGDLVTQIVDGRNCVFTTYGKNGMCMCALEKHTARDAPISASPYHAIFTHCASLNTPHSLP